MFSSNKLVFFCCTDATQVKICSFRMPGFRPGYIFILLLCQELSLAHTVALVSVLTLRENMNIFSVLHTSWSLESSTSLCLPAVPSLLSSQGRVCSHIQRVLQTSNKEMRTGWRVALLPGLWHPP